jgi:GDP-4-dehydro-6-deoxy-D-mannose reductase
VRALVTGGNGFVGTHLCAELRTRGHVVVSTGHVAFGPSEVPLDLEDLEGIRDVVQRARPQVVYHLAARASVADAVSDPLTTYRVNVMGTANIVETLREFTGIRFVFASSAEVYGGHPLAEMPLRESAAAAPATIYAASKLAAEAIVLASARTFAMHSVIVRPFNLIGPGQSERFAVGAFSHRLAAIAAGGPALFPVGNLSAQRDFLDVRDAAKALADVGERGADGEIYNVCSGKPTSIAEVLRQLVFAARVGVEIREDPDLMRPVDVPMIYGDYTKLHAATGWSPSIPLGATLRDAYSAAREVIAHADAKAAGHV